MFARGCALPLLAKSFSPFEPPAFGAWARGRAAEISYSPG